MAVTVKKTAGTTAVVTWDKDDDPRGYLARAVEGDQLAYALEALGDDREAGIGEDASEASALQAAMHTTALARLLERRAALQVVQLRDERRLSWRRIAAAIHDNPEMQSTVRRQYDSGRRHLGR